MYHISYYVVIFILSNFNAYFFYVRIFFYFLFIVAMIYFRVYNMNASYMHIYIIYFDNIGPEQLSLR